MKLETTLDERPGFLHALPLFDLFMMVTMLLLLGPTLLSQSGVTVELPASQFQMQRYRESIVLTLNSGLDKPQIYLGRKAISRQELQVKLKELKSDETMSRAIVLMKTDVGTPVGLQREIVEMVLQLGFKIALVGEPQIGIPEIDQSDE